MSPTRRDKSEVLNRPRKPKSYSNIELGTDDIAPGHTPLSVSQKAYDKFLARLDAPPQPNERLRRAMKMTAPWEKK
jgi:Protein of unknown function (DUF1778)